MDFEEAAERIRKNEKYFEIILTTPKTGDWIKILAQKRMFTMKIVDSDAFLDMPVSAQLLYFHLGMRADDDGFVDRPKRIMKDIGVNEDDLKILIAKKFILTFDNGLLVIKHWRMHNTLSKNRYHETQYLEEKRMLLLKDNGAYSLTTGKPIDDTRLLEMSERQSVKQNNKIDEQKTNNRRTIDEQKTNADKGLGLDKDLELELDLDTGLDKEKKLNNLIVSKDTICQNDIQQIITEWNKLEEFGIAPVKRMTSKREQAVKARIRQNQMEDILEAIENIRHSSFLQGQNKDGWMITFDWFLKPGNFAKVFEGNYLDKSENKPQSYMEKIQNRVSEVDSWV